MSKAIVIKKDGVSQNLTVDKLRTNDADGQSIDWVPEDTVQLAVLNATANGTYTPTGGKYGFEYATVSVPGSVVTGKKSDGDTYVYTKDGNGALVETKVPTEIRITTPPTKLIYADGETIDYTGIVVKAYYADSGEWGTVPYNELVFPVTTADAQQQNEWSDGAGLNAALITYSPTWNRKIERGVETENQVYAHTTALGTDRYGRPASLVGDGPATLYVTRYDNALTVNPTTVTPSNLHAVQSLPVNWSRPGDGAILETSFDITVQQSLGGATGGGGEAGETGAGRND